MPSAQHTTTINRPPEVVFAYVLDGEKCPEWRTHVMDIKRISGDGGVGSVYAQGVRGPMGRRIAADYEVTVCEPNRLLEFQTIAGPARPRICFLPTATGDSADYVVRFYEAFRERAEPSHLELFGRPRRDIRDFLLGQDVVYVGGGNTANMLAIWRVHGVDAVLREAWERGIVLAGISAGSICWFEGGVTDSFGDELAPLPCLGFLPGSNCPHYDSEPQRRPTYRRLVDAGELPPGLAAEDGAGLHFVGAELAEAVAGPGQDKKLFESLLKEALDFDVDAPAARDYRLANVLARRRAGFLLAHESDILSD